MDFEPENPDDIIRSYKKGTSIVRLAEACGVSFKTMEEFLVDRRVHLKPRAKPKTNLKKNYPQRPSHIVGEAFSEDWWDSNNKAYCDAMSREYPEWKP